MLADEGNIDQIALMDADKALLGQGMLKVVQLSFGDDIPVLGVNDEVVFAAFRKENAAQREFLQLAVVQQGDVGMLLLQHLFHRPVHDLPEPKRLDGFDEIAHRADIIPLQGKLVALGDIDNLDEGIVFPDAAGGGLTIDIQKQIPMAAGLAVGSSNCAAVLHAINQLWELNLSVKELCRIGARLGSDVPFCIMGQAAAEKALQESFADDPDACHCALATGTGTDLKPLTGLNSFIVLSKPAIGVSTAEVYRGIDNEGIPRHPDNNAVISAIFENNYKVLAEKMVNVLENFALKRYPIIVYTKNIMSDLCQSAGIPNCVMMSGSGPTVFCLCEELSKAQQICEVMKSRNPESFVAKTTGQDRHRDVTREGKHVEF